MKFNSKDWDFICTRASGKGKYKLMVYNPKRKELYCEGVVDEKYVRGEDSYGNPYSAAELSRDTFDVIFEKLFRYNGCATGFFEIFDGDDKSAGNDSHESKIIPKETVFSAIRGELTEKEMDDIVQKNIEPADYYDFDAFISVIHKFLRGEVSRNYFTDWMIIVSWALGSNKFKEDTEKYLLYEELSDCFDGHSFDALEETKEVECRELIASIKFKDHLIKNVSKGVIPPFYNDGKVVVYLCFDFCNGHNTHYKMCVADKKRKTFKTTVVSNPDYLESVNYTFVDGDEFDDLTNEYYDFYHDKFMDVSRYISEGVYLDANGNPIKSAKI